MYNQQVIYVFFTFHPVTAVDLSQTAEKTCKKNDGSYIYYLRSKSFRGWVVGDRTPYIYKSESDLNRAQDLYKNTWPAYSDPGVRLFLAKPDKVGSEGNSIALCPCEIKVMEILPLPNK